MRAVHGAVVQVQRVRAAEFGQQNGVQAWRDAVTQPDAVLCRTNVGAMAQVMTLMAAGYRVAFARGGDSLQALALAARDLKEGRRRTHHPELILFPCWGDLQDYAAQDPAGRVRAQTLFLLGPVGAWPHWLERVFTMSSRRPVSAKNSGRW
jgi:hypothetical protein